VKIWLPPLPPPPTLVRPSVKVELIRKKEVFEET